MNQSMTSTPPLNLPDANLNIRKDNDLVKVFDILRQKFVALTPEEFVRQTFVSYLINHLHYPKSIMANEIQIELNGTIRRCDTVVFSAIKKPLMIVEYKAPSVSISQDVFNQIVRYNMVLKAKYLVVSNGIAHYCCKINYDENKYSFLHNIPDFSEI